MKPTRSPTKPPKKPQERSGGETDPNPVPTNPDASGAILVRSEGMFWGDPYQDCSKSWPLSQTIVWDSKCGEYRVYKITTTSRSGKDEEPYYACTVKTDCGWWMVESVKSMGPGYPVHYKSLDLAMLAGENHLAKRMQWESCPSNRMERVTQEKEGKVGPVKKASERKQQPAKKEDPPTVLGTLRSLVGKATEQSPVSRKELLESLVSVFPDRDREKLEKKVKVFVPHALGFPVGMVVKGGVKFFKVAEKK